MYSVNLITVYRGDKHGTVAWCITLICCKSAQLEANYDETTNKANCKQRYRLDWTETGPEFGFQTVCEVQISLTKDTIWALNVWQSVSVKLHIIPHSEAQILNCKNRKRNHVFDWKALKVTSRTLHWFCPVDIHPSSVSLRVCWGLCSQAKCRKCLSGVVAVK